MPGSGWESGGSPADKRTSAPAIPGGTMPLTGPSVGTPAAVVRSSYEYYSTHMTTVERTDEFAAWE